VGKHWKPGKKTVELDPQPRPSRIRRDPVTIVGPARRQRPSNQRERDLFFGIAGILVFGTIIAAGIIAFSIFTVLRDDPAADARYARFGQCYNAEGPNCVLDGSTVYVGGERVQIAGIEAPKIADAKCDREHDRGIEAAVQLAQLLNSGPVTLGQPFRDQSGHMVRKVEAKGRDVALNLINQSVAREAGSSPSWC
jgi:micrococcal nuclease